MGQGVLHCELVIGVGINVVYPQKFTFACQMCGAVRGCWELQWCREKRASSPDTQCTPEEKMTSMNGNGKSSCSTPLYMALLFPLEPFSHANHQRTDLRVTICCYLCQLHASPLESFHFCLSVSNGDSLLRPCCAVTNACS